MDLTAALAYAKQGFPVFTLAPRSKLPLILAREGGHGLHDATTDLDQIGAWWQAHSIEANRNGRSPTMRASHAL
jgi:Bifunctional DNA primase/polymerase, N-terminal